MGLTWLPNQRHEMLLLQHEALDEMNWNREVRTDIISNLMQAPQIPNGWTAALQGYCSEKNK